MSSPTHVYKYNPSATVHEAHKFLYENWVVKKIPTIVGILGPPNSGKTVGSILMFDLIYTYANKAADGDRYIRIGILRKTIAELRKTVLKTIKEWFPVGFGTFVAESEGSNTPFSGVFHIPHPSGDGSTCHVEIIGVPYDGATDEDAISVLRSQEFTCFYINEVPTMRENVFSATLQRAGRYPSNKLGAPLPKLVICDYNMPYSGSWAIDLVSRNKDYLDEDGEVAYTQRIFVQPPAALRTEVYGDKSDINKITDYIYKCNPAAEIPPVFPKNYYAAEILAAKERGDWDYLDRELCMLPVIDTAQKPVYARAFNKDKHIVANTFWDAQPHRRTVVGFDTSGLNLAAVFLQEARDVNYRPLGWVVTNEIYMDGGLLEFLELIASLTNVRGGRGLYDIHDMILVCDPANARNQNTKLSPVEQATQPPYNFHAVCAPTNVPELRIQCLTKFLAATVAPFRLFVRDHCTMVIEGLAGAHAYPRIGKTLEYSHKPNKNTRYSHYMDALEYAALYIHENHAMMQITSNFPSLPPVQRAQQ